MLFVDEKPNMQRQYEFDYAKAFAILFLAVCHVYEELSVVDCGVPPETWFDTILQFITGPLAAPIYMIAMGVGIVYSTHRSPAVLARRGLMLFGMAYALGFFRDGLTYTVLSLLTGECDWAYTFELICNVDILQFAGLTFLLTALLKRWNVPVPVMGVIAVLMQVLGQFLSRIEVTSVVGQCLLGLFWYTSYDSCFPLLLWYIYPVIGIIMAKYLRHVSDTDQLYRRLFMISGTALCGYCFSLYFAGYDLRQFYMLADDAFYRQDFLSVFFSVCALVFEMSLFHYFHKKLRPERLWKGVRYLSSNLNTIYIIQWLIIGNIAEVIDALGLPWWEKWTVVPAGLVIIAASVGLTALWRRFKAQRKAKA